MPIRGLLYVCLILVGCNAQTKSERSADNAPAQNNQSSSDNSQVNDSGYAYAELYSSDAFESAIAPEDEITQEDLEEAKEMLLDQKDEMGFIKVRVDEMISLLFEAADADDSGNLNEPEFVGFRIMKFEIDEEMQEKIEERRTKLFAMAAGDDELMSEEELRILIKAHRKIVMKMWKKRGPHHKFLKRHWAKAMEKYDEDRNGKLDEAEKERMHADFRAKVKSFREKMWRECPLPSNLSGSESMDWREVLRGAKPMCKLHYVIWRACGQAYSESNPCMRDHEDLPKEPSP